MLTDEQIAAAKQAIENHGVIAYPTEAVFGLGCAPYDEIAVRKVLELKQRPIEKGVILIAADYSQLLDYVDDSKIGQDARFKVFSHWPGPITLLLPAKASVPKFLKGEHDTIAVRVTAFEPVRKLCRVLNTPLVSTSANRSGQPPFTDAEQVIEEFKDEVSWVWQSSVGQAKTPSKIINPFTGEVFRA
ncbi:threonylcarbamoyl-AMP synthase [Lysobacter sp. N42]|nr:L-threonylcarbamoyladenylate synthase [Aliidiomarina sp. B3213]RTE86808.1 threonylcarbamoyl-AMP synthase [Aliidiomarina sp. B3213]TCZ91024.1 threonylcarbamoyl-AMP synthase [Lysobacter sp. N42]